MDYSGVLVLIAALNEEEGIGHTLFELKKTFDRPNLNELQARLRRGRS